MIEKTPYRLAKHIAAPSLRLIAAAALIAASMTGCGTAPAGREASPDFSGYPQQGEPARRHLQHMKANLTGPEATTVYGPYTYIRIRQWPTPTDPHMPGLLVEETTWRAADGSGAWSSQRIHVAAGTSQPVEEAKRRTFDAGGLPALEAPAPDVVALGGMIDHHEETKGLSMPGVIAAWNRQYCMDHRQREAILQILSDTSELSYLGGVHDRAGRWGHAFALIGRDPHDKRVRDILVIHGPTGKLLSHEREEVGVAAGMASKTISYVLFLDCGHTQHPRGTP